MTRLTTAGAIQGALLFMNTMLPRAIQAQEPGGPHLEIRQIIEKGDTGPVLLLIPCAACGARSWEPFMEANEARFRMIAVTLPGYAGTPRPNLPLWGPEPVFQENAVAQLSRLIDERGLDDVHVVGQSFGSHIGMLLAAARPDRVRTLVNVDGSPTNPVEWADDDAEALIHRARETVDEDWALRLQDPDTFRQFNAATRQPPDQRLIHHGMFMATDRVSMLHYWRENMLRDRNPMFRDLEAAYLDVKAVFPWDANPDSTLSAYVESLESVGTPATYRRVVFWDTTHWVHLDRPRALGTVIADHIRGALPVPQPATITRSTPVRSPDSSTVTSTGVTVSPSAVSTEIT